MRFELTGRVFYDSAGCRRAWMSVWIASLVSSRRLRWNSLTQLVTVVTKSWAVLGATFFFDRDWRSTRLTTFTFFSDMDSFLPRINLLNC